MSDIVRRESYLSKLHAGRGLTDVVKVVTGMRRAGKSTLLRMYMDDLAADGVDPGDMILINLETFEYNDIEDHKELDRILKERIADGHPKYVFLDELQNVKSWEKSVSALINTGRCDVYITGSNSHMLSSELTTHIAGRFIEIKVLPLSFSEYLELRPGDRDERFAQYLRFGSLPEIDPALGEGFCEGMLRAIYDSIIVNDVLARLGNGNVNKLKAIARFLYDNIGNVTNTSTIAKATRMSDETVDRYLSMMEEGFLFYRAEKYDIVGKRLLETNGKVYASDLGLRNAALLGARGADISRSLENIVYLELLRRGYVVRVGSFRDWGVDFTASRNDTVEYYQVCLTMMAPETRDRELRPLNGIRDNFPKTVLTMDRHGLGSENGIHVENVLDWLLDDSGRRSEKPEEKTSQSKSDLRIQVCNKEQRRSFVRLGRRLNNNRPEGRGHTRGSRHLRCRKGRRFHFVHPVTGRTVHKIAQYGGEARMCGEAPRVGCADACGRKRRAWSEGPHEGRGSAPGMPPRTRYGSGRYGGIESKQEI